MKKVAHFIQSEIEHRTLELQRDSTHQKIYVSSMDREDGLYSH